MPFVNGKFYMNPAYGRAVEGARDAEDLPGQPDRNDQGDHWVTINGNHVLIHEGQDAGAPRKDDVRMKAGVGYGETRGLFPQQSPGHERASPYDRSKWDKRSFEQLQAARRNIMDLSERNPDVRRMEPNSTAGVIERSVWDDNIKAANQSDGSMPGRFFFIRQQGVGPQRSPARAGFGQSGRPIRSYGPFVNVGGGDVPRGNRTYIDIYEH